MYFSSVIEVRKFLENLRSFGLGAQGESFLSKDKTCVYKILHDYDLDDFEEISKDKILQFSDIENKTFVFPYDTIMLKDLVIGYISKYAEGKDLCDTNLFNVNLDFLISVIDASLGDVKKISDNGVWTYDVMYNIMLGSKLHVVDSLEYSRVDMDTKLLLQHNLHYYNMGFMYFLVDDYFDDVINSNKILKEMYETGGLDISVIEFIKTFKYYLSELVGHEISNLGEARKLVNKQRKDIPGYIRNF